jgi:hypothetical protein
MFFFPNNNIFLINGNHLGDFAMKKAAFSKITFENAALFDVLFYMFAIPPSLQNKLGRQSYY